MRAAVLGVGQTRHRSKRTDVSIAGLCREAADRALADAGLTFADIDAVVVGKAPDLFEGVMMPELYLADALGAEVEVNPSGGALCANPMFAAGLARIGCAAQAIMSGRASRSLGHATSGPALQQNLVCLMEGR